LILPQASNDSASTRNDAGAEFLIVAHASLALCITWLLSACRTYSDGQHETDSEQSLHFDGSSISRKISPVVRPFDRPSGV
jgi:hypothetical protein